jgi:hypothetical protein
MKLLLTLSTLICATTMSVERQAPMLEDLLKRVGVYVGEYERAFSVVVARERYVQRAFAGPQMETRDLRSEVALIAVQGADWVFFRDVYQADGREVHDRRDRLASLFVTPPKDAGAQARRIFEESTRFNIGRVERTINSPTQVLEFARPANHARSRFNLGSRSTIAGRTAWEIRFQETGRPRVIRTSDDAAAFGRIWVLPDSGAVVRTELQLSTARGSIQITVHYALEDRLMLWVPSRMIESYVRPPATGGSVLTEDSSGVRVEGEATYSDYRRFNVDTRTIIR